MPDNVVVSITYDDAGVQAAAKRIEAANQRIVSSTTTVTETQRKLAPAAAAGADAFSKLERATQPAITGIKALDIAIGGIQGGLVEISSRAGMAGSALQALGTSSLAVAGGVAAAILVFSKFASASQEVSRYFADVSDAADRVGTSAGRLQALDKVALANAGSTQKLETALELLAVAAQKAVDGNQQLVDAFQRSGVSVDFLKQSGGDAVVVLLELAKHGVSTADAIELMGRSAKSLGPTIQALKGDVSILENEGLTPLAQAFNDLDDKSTLLAIHWKEIDAPYALAYQQQILGIKEALLEATEAAVKFSQNMEDFWSRVFSKEALSSLAGMRGALRQGLGIEEGVPAPAAEERMLARSRAETGPPPPSPLTIRIGPKPPKPGREAREPSLKFEQGAFEAAPWLVTAEEDFGKFNRISEESLSKTQRDAETLAKRISDSYDQAMGHVIELTNRRRDEDLKAINLMAANEQEKAQLRVKVNQIADEEIANDQKKYALEIKDSWEPSGWDKMSADLVEFGETLTSTQGMAQGVIAGIAGIGTTAISSFADAIVAGNDLSDILGSLATTLEKTMIQLTLTMALQQAIGGAATGLGQSGFLASIFGGAGAGAYPAAGTGVSAGAMPAGMAGEFMIARGATLEHGWLAHGIYTHPTLFPLETAGFHPMARGVGLLGEAGPEAVLPLRRTAGGRLGVESSGGGNQTVIVNNYTGAQVNETRTRNINGDMTVILDVLEQHMAGQAARSGTPLNRALSHAANPIRAR